MRFKKLYILTICTLLATVMLILGCVSPAQEQVIKGDSFLKQLQWDEAIAAYNKAIELDPKLNDAELNMNLATAYDNRGTAYDNNTEYDNAIADYTNAIELAPKLAVAELNTKLAAGLQPWTCLW